jgi:flagellar biosynthetic protein FliO
VLAVIAGVAWLVRRLVPSVRRLNGGVIEVLGRNHLAPKQSLALVRVGRRVLLIGVTAERLTTLCQIDEPEELAELLVGASAGRSTAGADRFDHLLGEAADGFDDAGRGLDETVPGRSEPLERARGRVQGLLSRLRALQAPE